MKEEGKEVQRKKGVKRRYGRVSSWGGGRHYSFPIALKTSSVLHPLLCLLL